jgi:hypothetical protein
MMDWFWSHLSVTKSARLEAMIRDNLATLQPSMNESADE